MATTIPLSPSTGQAVTQAGAPRAPQGNAGQGNAGAGAALGEQGLVPSPQKPEFEPSPLLAGPFMRLPVELDVSVPIRDFRVRHLLTLEPSSLIESGWGPGEDVPLAAGHVQLAWTEFEVVDTQLAVRVTRLS